MGHFPRLATGFTLLTVFLLVGCGRQMSRSVEPASSSATIAPRSALPSASANELPVATIVTPVPSTVFSTYEPAPLRFEWTGADADGHIREYRYCVFGQRNPDFPFVPDFIAFISSNPQEVLSYYESVKWEGWDRIQVKKDTQPSATYSALLRNQLYAFVVVAIDNRGAHDETLTRERNVIQFAIASRVETPSLTFIGPFGQATVASESEGFVEVVTSQVSLPFEISWFATPQPGSVIKGYRNALELGRVMEPTSLADTSTLLQNFYLHVEVEYDDGKRALYSFYINQFPATTGATRASR